VSYLKQRISFSNIKECVETLNPENKINIDDLYEELTSVKEVLDKIVDEEK